MRKSYRKFLLLVLMMISVGMLSGFFYGKKDTPLPNMPKGNTETEQTIVVRFDSTAEQILKETSADVRFMAYKTSNGQRISTLSTPIADFTSKRFSLLDKTLGFSAEKIHKFTIHFDDKTQAWTSIYFYPYEPSKWGTESEVLGYLSEWVGRVSQAEWKACNGAKLWKPYVLPTPESKLYKKPYMRWTANGHRLTLLVKRAGPTTFKNIKDHPKYNLEINISNKTKFNC